MRRNHGHKSFHIPRVKQYFHFQELQRVKKSFTNLPKVCMKSHNDQHQCKQNLHTVGGATALSHTLPPRSHRSLGLGGYAPSLCTHLSRIPGSTPALFELLSLALSKDYESMLFRLPCNSYALA